MKKLILLFVALTLSTGLWAQGSVITYTATEKLSDFFVDFGNFGFVEIVSHDYDQETHTGTITFQDVITTIGDETFWGCSTLTSITIPASVTTIGENAFDHCTSLTSITIPSMVTKIGNRAFNGCSSLESATIKAGDIGKMIFSGCTNLKSITLGNAVTSIDDETFFGCNSETSVTFLGSFYGTIGDRFYFTLDSGVVLPVIKIEEKADKDTDASGCYHLSDGSVMEFVIDSDIANDYFGRYGNGLVLQGNYANYKLFSGEPYVVKGLEAPTLVISIVGWVLVFNFFSSMVLLCALGLFLVGFVIGERPGYGRGETAIGFVLGIISYRGTVSCTSRVREI